VEALREHVSAPAAIRYVLERVEAEVKRLHGHVPEEIKLKRAALTGEERRIANFIEFIGDGKGTPVLADALQAAEHKAEGLHQEVSVLETTVNDGKRRGRPCCSDGSWALSD
jgi:hypothetical protein